ncbi:MAG TPA: phosphoglycerate kinase [Thermoanaerobaculia bacterium]|jgi:phosphoglycerate kinase|nr:phosphoglycerate kinase [Thermoanaerobaculia bacterium]
MKSIRDLSLQGRNLFLRVDFNVPLDGGRVLDDTRIAETLPTVRLAMERGARVICASHLGKAKGRPKPELSLAPVAARFAQLLGRPVRFVEDCVGPEAAKAADALAPGEVLLLENLRFHAGEEANDPEFAAGLAALAEVYVDDAFGAAHRAHASVVGVPRRLKEKGAGLLLEREVRELSRLLEPERPFAAILGGAKISGKIDTLRVLARRADVLLVGGGMANHFVRALGLSVGRSLLEEDKVPLAREILDFCKEEGNTIALPSDFVVAKSPDDAAGARTVGINKIPDDLMALDIGPRTLEQFGRLLGPVKTIFWNGPMGVFEKPPFDAGTMGIARMVAASPAVTVVGGGESVQAAHAAGVARKFTHVSTGGGASLEFLAEGRLPGIEALEA